ncbi:hypothetical protein Cni_G12875 [Canna indica]|uniref:TLC domain-containing protein n=1 Tax=Canna indica TaxID=4628 RepID=A0AAQ3QB12_9LILI|nr:hypothetical protein Cni_G12875 [Canna indica]
MAIEHWLLPLIVAAFCSIYLLGYFVVFRKWSPKHRPEASSCFMSLFHGTPAVLLAIPALLLPRPVRRFAAPNTGLQSLVLDFSTAYFAVDLLHYLFFIPPQASLYVAHHLAALFVFLTCRYLVAHGAFSILVLLVLAEVTSACENAVTLTGLRKTESAVAAKVHRWVTPAFYAAFTVARGLVGPVFFYKMSAYYLSGKARDVIPAWVSTSWIVVVGGAILGSILWISNLWFNFFRVENNVEMNKAIDV